MSLRVLEMPEIIVYALRMHLAWEGLCATVFFSPSVDRQPAWFLVWGDQLYCSGRLRAMFLELAKSTPMAYGVG